MRGARLGLHPLWAGALVAGLALSGCSFSSGPSPDPAARRAAGQLTAEHLTDAAWSEAATAQAAWLEKGGVAGAHGFFTNVSNFDITSRERDYAGRVSSRIGGKHYVVDVSRNGNGWTGTWCNPAGAALGQDPRVTEGTDGKLDALLWVKHPGVSDGSCSGAPAAGVWWQAGAQALIAHEKGGS